MQATLCQGTTCHTDVADHKLHLDTVFKDSAYDAAGLEVLVVRQDCSSIFKHLHGGQRLIQPLQAQQHGGCAGSLRVGGACHAGCCGLASSPSADPAAALQHCLHCHAL